ncbi:hypothetical protein [Actinophytocola glycyrrhizae]|uniref:Uncharacterized protein n=1 Tax=Actinophytocola glycyrrhizae TaxID=2044873 RepID=A0ABV9RYB0_9PSEU
MTGQDGGFSHAARRFVAEVDSALTRARRAAREARATSEEFRRSTEELGAQAKTGKLRGLRRGEVTATAEQARAAAVEFRTANGLPVAELPGADALIARLPAQAPDPAAVREQEDFSQHRVLFDVDGPGAAENADMAEETAESGKTGAIDPSDAEPSETSDDDEDFSQQRILLDATVESYRPEGMLGAVFDPVEPETARSERSAERGPDTGA